MSLKTNYPIWSDQSEPSLVLPGKVLPDPLVLDDLKKSIDEPSCAILVSTVPDMGFITKLAAPLYVSQSLYMGKLIVDSKDIIIVGPYMGAAYAVMLLEILASRGVNHIIVMGWCGALDNHLEPGDLVIPIKAIQDEGVSRHYLDTGDTLSRSLPDLDLSEKLIGYLEENGESPIRADIWTTDAIFRETSSKVNWFRNQGAQVVDMECSALFSVASFHKIKLSALLVVSDCLTKDSWNSGFSRKRFNKNRKSACRHLLGFARSDLIDENLKNEKNING